LDVNNLRIAVTVVSLLTFLGLMVWVGLRRNKPGFDEAALIPFADPVDGGSS
jgi:cytochrome c oxidase cbb3-type subunit IV